jgi:hypothetical protein
MLTGAPSAASSSSAHSEMVPGESLHWACKIILMVVKYRGQYAKNLIELIVSRLCEAVTCAPVAVVLHCQQILRELAPLQPLRVARLLTAQVTGSTYTHTHGHGHGQESSMAMSGQQTLRLVALTALAETVKHLSGPILLGEMPSIVPSALPLFGSHLVDIRKAVVFLLVEIFMVVGDALHPFVADLPAVQKKLLTIYIDRQMLNKQQHLQQVPAC